MCSRVHIGDIVLANYYTFTQEVKVGMFIVYHIDSTIDGSIKTMAALKISTKPQSFQLKLSSNQYRFLNHDSYINANATQRLYIDNITNILGRVSSSTMSALKTQFKNYVASVLDDMDEYIANGEQNTLSFAYNPHNPSNEPKIENHKLMFNGQTIDLAVVAQLLLNNKSKD